MDEHQLQRAAAIIMEGGVVALTGAGVSTESGIPDFRGKKGLWSRYDIAEYGTLGAFRRNPAKVWEMLSELMQIIDAQPNAGHRCLAMLEQSGCLLGVVTQNIDGLHQKAGSRTVVEFHGSAETLHCLKCRHPYQRKEFEFSGGPPSCWDCGEFLKPDIVFYDERIPDETLMQAEKLIHSAKTLLVAGTSCQVVPASYFPAAVHARGGRIIEINKAPVLDDIADVTLNGGFSSVMTRLIETMEASPLSLSCRACGKPAQLNGR